MVERAIPDTERNSPHAMDLGAVLGRLDAWIDILLKG